MVCFDIRVGRILDIENFPEARKPSYKLKIGFGSDVGEKQSSAQITSYSKEELKDKLVLAVVNFPPKKIAGFTSEVLTLGVPGKGGVVVLVEPEREVSIGVKLF